MTKNEVKKKLIKMKDKGGFFPRNWIGGEKCCKETWYKLNKPIVYGYFKLIYDEIVPPRLPFDVEETKKLLKKKHF